MPDQWFAIRTKSNRESLVSAALAGKGYETLLPRMRSRKKMGAHSVRPFFPGYVFGRFDPVTRLPILTIPGVLEIVGWGKEPAPLDDSEIDSLKILAESSLDMFSHPFIRVGEKVKIACGPLTGAEGLVVRTDRDKFVVMISLLQRAIAVEICKGWLEV